MKKAIRPALAFFIGTAVVLVAAGCATTKSTSQALVCPQCKVLSVTNTITVFDESESNLSPHDKEIIETSHSCPGCQGALTTFFKEGKLKHKCSICEQAPFSCPVAHH